MNCVFFLFRLIHTFLPKGSGACWLTAGERIARCQFSVIVKVSRVKHGVRGYSWKHVRLFVLEKTRYISPWLHRLPFPTPAFIIRQKRDPRALISIISCWVLGPLLGCSHFWNSINTPFGAYVLIFLLHQISVLHFYFFLLGGTERSINDSSTARKSLF